MKNNHIVVPLMARLPGELHAQVKAQAVAEERSLNWMVVALLRDGLKARGGETVGETRPAAPEAKR